MTKMSITHQWVSVVLGGVLALVFIVGFTAGAKDGQAGAKPLTSAFSAP